MLPLKQKYTWEESALNLKGCDISLSLQVFLIGLYDVLICLHFPSLILPYPQFHAKTLSNQEIVIPDCSWISFRLQINN